MMRRTGILIFVLLAGSGRSLHASAGAAPMVDVVVGSSAPELERFAASELCSYLAKLFGIQAYPSRGASSSAQVVFLIGSPQTNASVKQAMGENGFGKITDQEIRRHRARIGIFSHRPASRGAKRARIDPAGVVKPVEAPDLFCGGPRRLAADVEIGRK